MKPHFSTHHFANGVIITAERRPDSLISIRVQGENENMLADMVCGEHEALCLAHSILSVAVHKDTQPRREPDVRM